MKELWNRTDAADKTDEPSGSLAARSMERFRTFIRGPGGWKAIVWAGLLGMGLILLSNFWQSPAGAAEESADSWDAAAYTASLEQRLTDLLGSVEGVGACQVMITLENARQYVYTDRHEVVTEIQPTVKGVIVVCDGAGNEAVAERVRTAVQTVLHITARRVCVTPSV